ncbi:hypothetical protein CHS0354_018754 [Potamilus streckersoni]|uniref:Small acidic protein n=1 Tax=Potamilus streckersoni TaxID=2493646 RepID=A0AAE0T407_9BIVA|nr:hypothetical protein CHS0354_018754 [Potamilus streckersoni]
MVNTVGKRENMSASKEDCNQRTSDTTTEDVQTKEDEIDPNKVHSPNSWETAELGDDERKKKFLRLMGAAKKEHHGRFVIGDQEPTHKRDSKWDDIKTIDSKLEEQYQLSLEHKMSGGRKDHIGLGFHEEKKAEELSKEKAEQGEESPKGDNFDKSEKSEKRSRSKDVDHSEESGKSEVKKMKFIKGDS